MDKKKAKQEKEAAAEDSKESRKKLMEAKQEQEAATQANVISTGEVEALDARLHKEELKKETPGTAELTLGAAPKGVLCPRPVKSYVEAQPVEHSFPSQRLGPMLTLHSCPQRGISSAKSFCPEK